MYSIAIASTVLFAIFSSTFALECRPVLCNLACRNGFDVDAVGCPRCACRATPQICLEPIFGYNCGSVDHRDCPSSHECQLHYSGLTGQCCLRSAGSTTGSSQRTTVVPQSTTYSPQTTTARPHTGQTTTPTATQRTSTAHYVTSTGQTSGSTARPFLFAAFAAMGNTGSTSQPSGASRVTTTYSSVVTTSSRSSTRRWF